MLERKNVREYNILALYAQKLMCKLAKEAVSGQSFLHHDEI